MGEHVVAALKAPGQQGTLRSKTRMSAAGL